MKRSVIVCCALFCALTLNAQVRVFQTKLTPKAEVQTPEVESRARGTAIFKLNRDRSVLTYRIAVTRINDVIGAHLHLAPAGQNGDVVVSLLNDAVSGRVNGTLERGRITAADLVGPLAGMSLTDLVEEIRAGNIYVNVHTEDFPDGEIRGQLIKGQL